MIVSPLPEICQRGKCSKAARFAKYLWNFKCVCNVISKDLAMMIHFTQMDAAVLGRDCLLIDKIDKN